MGLWSDGISLLIPLESLVAISSGASINRKLFLERFQKRKNGNSNHLLIRLIVTTSASSRDGNLEKEKKTRFQLKKLAKWAFAVPLPDPEQAFQRNHTEDKIYNWSRGISVKDLSDS